MYVKGEFRTPERCVNSNPHWDGNSYWLSGTEVVRLTAQHSGMMRNYLSKRTFLGWPLRVLCLAAQCCLSVSTVSAAVASAPIEYLQAEYLVDTWQTEQGLPDNYLNDIAQTPDGYLWVATFNGLARFNGVEFVAFDAANTPELPSSRIVHLDLDRKGRLWLRSEYGHLSQWRKGRFRTFTEHDGLPEKRIEVLVEDHFGEIWANTSWHQTNYYHYDSGRDVFKPVSSTNTLFDRFGRGSDIEGYGWGIRSNYLFSVRPEKAVNAQLPSGLSSAWRLVGARDGGMWVIGHGVQKFREGSWEDWGKLPVATDQFTGYIEDRRGNLWIGTGVGELWQAGTNHVIRRFKLQNSATTELGRNICEDAEGNLWLCTGGNGLLRLKPRAFKTYDSRDGLTSDLVRSVAEDRQGNIWLATVNAVDCFSSNRHRAQRLSATGGRLAWSVFGDSKGATWVGFYGTGLCRIEGENVTWFKESEARHSVDIHVVFEDKAGEIHLGTPRGLYGIDGNTLTRQKGAPDSLAMDIRCMAEGKPGELYLGLNGEGLLRKTANGSDRFTTREGLADDHVWALYADENKTLWIGTHGRGLSRFKEGRFFNFNQAELPRVITCILEDDMGHLWFGSKQGLFRAERSKLNELAEGRGSTVDITHYDRLDGMGSSQCTGDRQPTAWKGRDGRLWFATMAGVTVVDPRSLPVNLRPPPVAIEQVLIDDKPAQTGGDRIEVPPGGRRLEFRYAGLSFTAPSKVRFQYRLEGVDENWVEANERRAAYYTKVPPGNYRFQVIAANNDNVWNKTGASLAVVVQPYIWQTGWFQVLSGILLVGAGAGLVRYSSVIRLRRRLANLERSHALERERVRISRDLHDHLGADLSQLALWSELAAQETAQPSVMTERMRSVSSLAREVVQNVDEIVWAVNPRNDSLDRFSGYVCEFSERVITNAGLRFRWESPDEIPAVPLPSDLRHNLFLATKEALNNVVKYAGATEARLHLHLINGIFTLTVSDNGRGFDETAAGMGNGSGNGLRNMRERMADCGGRLTVESRPREGTSIRMTVPLPVHHAK